MNPAMIRAWSVAALVALAAPAAARAEAGEIPVQKLIPKYADATSRFVRIDGMDVHYRDEGKGPPILLLHGILSSLHTWDGWTAALKSEHRVVRLDLPGFGLTGPKPDRKYSLDYVLGFLDRFMARTGLARVKLVGNSLGGWFAWEYALVHPERVESLILIDAAGTEISDPPLPVRIAQWPVLGSGFTLFTPRWVVQRFVESVYGDPSKVDDRLVDRYYELFLREGNRQAFVDISNSEAADHSALLSMLRMPTLILWGGRDRINRRQDAVELLHVLPDAWLFEHDRCGHWPCLEEPDWVSDRLRDFLFQNRRVAA